MNTVDNNAHKKELLDQILLLFAHCANEDRILSREDFLPRSWHHITSFISNTRANPLVRDTVKTYRDFSVRAYTLLTVQYGLFNYEPDIVQILKEAIGLLGKDLIEEELHVWDCVNSHSRLTGCFFPELSATLKQIEDVYSAKYLDRRVLPPTAYLAYAFFTLNNKEFIGKDISQEEMFGKLAILDGKMSEIHTIVESTQKSQQQPPQ